MLRFYLRLTRSISQPCSVIQEQLCNVCSRYSISFQIAFGLFLYCTGTSCQAIDILSKLGLSICYESLLPANEYLSAVMISRVQTVARLPHTIGWDNIQICTSTHVKQWYLGPSKVQTGTTTIIYPLRGASEASCELEPIEKNLLKELSSWTSEHLPVSSGMSALLLSCIYT